jgi:hypothetical protein
VARRLPVSRRLVPRRLVPRRLVPRLGGALLLLVAGSAIAAPPLLPVRGGSFPARHREYVALARDGSDRALELLFAAYRRRDLEPTERDRIVTLLCDKGCAAAPTALAGWRARARTDGDVWLWYRSLRRELLTDAVAGGRAATGAVLDAGLPAPLRAAALRALGAVADPGIPALVVELTKSELGRGAERAVLVEAAADALASAPGRVGAPEVRAAFAALAPSLRKGVVDTRTRLVVSRAFARLTGSASTAFDPGFYEAAMDRLARPPSEDDERYAPPCWFGIEGTGDRVVYVLDESGSMSANLTPAEREDLERPSGARAGTNGGSDPFRRLPWDRIRTRRDAAIEMTKASIRALPETSSFAVLLFDTNCRWLLGAPELLPAVPRHVEAAIAALDVPHKGGGTNLHGGIRRAFDAVVGRKSPAITGSAWTPEFLRGPSTIFVLSDGAPSADDWGFGGGAVGPTRGVPIDGENGPYGEADSIADDVSRLCLLASVEVHTIGIGESPGDLLERIARVGRGRARTIGDRGPPIPTTWGAGAARDLVEALELLGRPVPEGLRQLAADEAAGERPTGPNPVPGPRPKPGRPSMKQLAATCVALRSTDSPSERLAAARRLGEWGYALATPDLIEALFGDADDRVRTASRRALVRFVGRDFGGDRDDGEHENVAARRNWTWWWELHAERIRKDAAALEAAEAGAEPK